MRARKEEGENRCEPPIKDFVLLPSCKHGVCHVACAQLRMGWVVDAQIFATVAECLVTSLSLNKYLQK